MAGSRVVLVIEVISALLCTAVGQANEEQTEVQRSAEVYSSGAARFIRTEAHQLEEAGEPSQLLEELESEAGYPQYQQYQQPQRQIMVAPADEKHADQYCGGPAFISTCGFKQTTPVSFSTATGKLEKIRGLCVCTHPKGCIEPVCDAGSCKNAAAPECADGNSCIKSAGDGWECWHPCNAAHKPAEYGTVNGQIVSHIRTMTQGCAAYGISGSAQAARPGPNGAGPNGAGARGAYGAHASQRGGFGAGGPGGRGGPQGFGKPTEPPLDAGIDLTYQSSPIFGSQVSATKNDAAKLCGKWAFLLGAVAVGSSYVL